MAYFFKISDVEENNFCFHYHVGHDRRFSKDEEKTPGQKTSLCPLSFLQNMTREDQDKLRDDLTLDFRDNIELLPVEMHSGAAYYVLESNPYVFAQMLVQYQYIKCCLAEAQAFVRTLKTSSLDTLFDRPWYHEVILYPKRTTVQWHPFIKPNGLMLTLKEALALDFHALELYSKPLFRVEFCLKYKETNKYKQFSPTFKLNFPYGKVYYTFNYIKENDFRSYITMHSI